MIHPYLTLYFSTIYYVFHQTLGLFITFGVLQSRSHQELSPFLWAHMFVIYLNEHP